MGIIIRGLSFSLALLLRYLRQMFQVSNFPGSNQSKGLEFWLDGELGLC